MYAYTCYVDNIKYIHYILFTVIDFVHLYLCLSNCRSVLGRNKAEDKPIKLVSPVK